MNNIFIDYKTSGNKKHRVKNYILKYSIVDDILNNKLVKNTYIAIDKNYLENKKNKNQYNLYDKIFKHVVNFKYSINDEVNVIFSNLFDNDSYIKSFILDLLRLNNLTIYNEVLNKNTLKENDHKHIKEYLKTRSKEIDKLKLLMVIDNINDFNKEKFIEYISKYKFVDILKTKNINGYDYRKLLNYIQNINKEYGTAVEIKQKRNLQNYDVLLIYSKINKVDFCEKYIVSNESLYLDFTDIDSDIYNDWYLVYKRYEPEVLTLLNRLNIKENNFSKQKLGYIFK